MGAKKTETTRIYLIFAVGRFNSDSLRFRYRFALSMKLTLQIYFADIICLKFTVDYNVVALNYLNSSPLSSFLFFFVAV